MSDRMSLQHAQDVAAGYGAYMVNEVRAARTIVAVGDVLDYLEKSHKHKSEIKYSTYGEGYVDGLDIAIGRLEKALGVDDE